MIIKAKQLPIPILKVFGYILSFIIKRRFNKLVINDIAIKENHSYLIMSNHFSFWDGFLAAYLCLKCKRKDQQVTVFYIMVLKKQMEKNPWLKYFGCFSIDPRKTTVAESLNYAAELLSKPGNVLILYPQGNLESNHVRDIILQDGINHIIPKITGSCQLIWSSNFIEFFESLKPSVFFHMMDAGTNHNYDFDKLTIEINQHHKKSMKKQFRFTED